MNRNKNVVSKEGKDKPSYPKSKRNTRRKGRGSKEPKFEKEFSSDGSNDPKWYAMNPELLRDSASIPFSWPVGTPIHEHTKVANDVVPGLCMLFLTPTIGKSTNMTDPINVAANATYSFVRHANSGHSNYDAPDLMMYMLAMSNMYSFITWVQRIYGVLMAYDQRNRYISDALLYGQNINYVDFRQHIADLRFWLNTLINKVASFAVPNVMPIFQRLAFLYSSYYTEGSSIKDQMYMMAPFKNQFYKFALDSQARGKLVLDAPNNSSSPVTYSELVTFGETLFNAIWEQEDFGIMSGDILKAYGDNIVKIAPVPEMLILSPVYDELVLHQFKNAKCYQRVDFSDITQDADGNIQQLQLVDSTLTPGQGKVMDAVASMNRILSTGYADPTPDVVIESTRLMPAWDSANTWFSSGTEFPRGVHFIAFNASGALRRYNGNTTQYFYEALGLDTLCTSTEASTNSHELDYFMNWLDSIFVAKEFKCAPEIMLGTYYSQNSAYYLSKMWRGWDIENYAVLNNNDLSKMHMAAIMSLFSVPSIAKL